MHRSAGFPGIDTYDARKNDFNGALRSPRAHDSLLENAMPPGPTCMRGDLPLAPLIRKREVAACSADVAPKYVR